MAFVYVKISFSQSNGHNFLKISGRVRYLRPTPQKASKRAAIAYGIKHRQASCPNVPITSGLLIKLWAYSKSGAEVCQPDIDDDAQKRMQLLIFRLWFKACALGVAGVQGFCVRARTDGNTAQRTAGLTITVVGALINCALNCIVGIAAVHIRPPLQMIR